MIIYNDKGSYTVETIMIFPVIFISLILILKASLFFYNVSFQKIIVNRYSSINKDNSRELIGEKFNIPNENIKIKEKNVFLFIIREVSVKSMINIINESVKFTYAHKVINVNYFNIKRKVDYVKGKQIYLEIERKLDVLLIDRY